MNRETMNREVRNHFRAQMPDRIKSLAAQASFDLNFGPAHPEGEDPIGTPWPGFEKATTELSAWCSEHVCDVWYDSNAEHVSESEPETHERCYECDGQGATPADRAHGYTCQVCEGIGYTDLDLSETYHMKRRDVMRAIFGELAEYL